MEKFSYSENIERYHLKDYKVSDRVGKGICYSFNQKKKKGPRIQTKRHK